MLLSLLQLKLYPEMSEMNIARKLSVVKALAGICLLMSVSYDARVKLASLSSCCAGLDPPQDPPIILPAEAEGSTITTNKITTISDIEISDDYSWLQNVKLGKWLGSGQYSDAFEMNFIHPPNSVSEKKEFIIKFSGKKNYNGKRDRQDDRWVMRASRAVYITQKLAAHPNIPQTVYFAKKVPNPFLSNSTFQNLQLPFELKQKNTTDTQRMSYQRLLSSKEFAIAIIERVVATHPHYQEGCWQPGHQNCTLDIPREKVSCFWRQFLETVDYAHTQNIGLVDNKIFNVLLQNGEMKFFDWNIAKLYESSKDRHAREQKGISPPFRLYECQDPDCKDLHVDDTRNFGRRLNEFLSDDEIRRTNGEANAISRRDRKLLKEIAERMLNDPMPPTLGWFVKHHPYFENTESCTLLW